MIDRSPEQILRAWGGTATTGELSPYVTRRGLHRAVIEGRIRRAARGRYVLPTLPDAEATAAALHGVLSHESAAQYWGIELLQPPARVHVQVAHGSWPAARPGVHVHQSRRADRPSEGLTAPAVGRQPATSPLQTVLDCATTLPFREALAIADSALALTFVSAAQLVEAAEQSRGPGRPRRLRVARSADRRAANPPESALRAVVIERGLRGFTPQCPVPIRERPRTGTDDWHVDLGDPTRLVALEAEGYATHGTRSGFSWDCERYDELVRRDWLVLRFSWEQIMFRADWVGDVVADVCTLRSRRR